MLNFGMLCLGQGGSNIGEYAVTKNFKCIAANTAKIDLNLLRYIPAENRLYLGGNGAGRNRDIGKSAILRNADKILNLAKDKLDKCDVVFVTGAGGGGTGSGSLPIAIEILSEIFSMVNVMYIFPDNSEAPSAKINALDCFSEISQIEQLGSILIVDNEMAKQKNPNLAKFKIHNITNKELIDLLFKINQFTDKNSYTNNFDERDFLDILSIRGCTFISKAEFMINRGIGEKDITSKIQQSWLNTCNPQYNFNNIVKAAMIMSIRQKDSAKINMENIFNGNIPFDIKDSSYNTINDMAAVYSIFSGLEFPNERLQEMKENVVKIEDNLVDRINKAKNQKYEGLNWKIQQDNIQKVSNENVEKISLADKLSKYRK